MTKYLISSSVPHPPCSNVLKVLSLKTAPNILHALENAFDNKNESLPNCHFWITAINAQFYYFGWLHHFFDWETKTWKKVAICQTRRRNTYWNLKVQSWTSTEAGCLVIINFHIQVNEFKFISLLSFNTEI